MRETDLADELFRAPGSAPPTGVRVATARRGGVTVTRVEIAREGLERPRGRYVTLEVPRVSLLRSSTRLRQSCRPCCLRQGRCWCWASGTGG